MVMPRARSSRSTANSRSRLALVQRRVRLVEDQQARLLEQHAAEFDQLLLADAEPADTGAWTSTWRPSWSRSSRLAVLHGARRDQPAAARLAVDEQIGQHRALGEQAELLVDDADAVLAGGVRRVDRRPAAPSSTIAPLSGRTTPASTFISVDLPAPFSPTTAWMVPRSTSRFMSVERHHAAVALGEVADGDQRRRSGHGVPKRLQARPERSGTCSGRCRARRSTPTLPRSASAPPTAFRASASVVQAL